MPVLLDPEQSVFEGQTTTDPPNPEALIEEARRLQRRRRRFAALAVGLVAVLATGAYFAIANFGLLGDIHGHTPAPFGPAKTRTLHLRLDGWGTPQPDRLGFGPCPWGRTYIKVGNAAGHPIGSDNECVLLVSKVDVPGYGVRSTHALVIATFRLPGGTMRVRETNDFRFARDQNHSQGRLRGRIIGGNGRYAHARGTLTGGGPGVNNTARWNVTLTIVRR